MKSLPSAWSGGEPEVGSVMDTLRIETIGHIPAKTDAIRARFPFYGAALVLRGRGFHQIDRGPVRSLEAPAVIWVWPGPHFDYGPDAGTSWEERYLCFNGPRVEDWLRWGWISRLDRPRSLAEPEVIEQMHRRICRAFPPFQDIPLDQAKIEIEQFIHELHRQTASLAPPGDGLAMLIQQWTKEPSGAGGLRAAARALGMSYSGFRQHFARRTGLAPHQFLLRLRIDRACLRLAQSADPIKAVADESGFSFVESFNRAFRQIKGITPGEYRRRMALLARRSG